MVAIHPPRTYVTTRRLAYQWIDCAITDKIVLTEKMKQKVLINVVSRVGLNLNFEFESAHELLMNLNLNSTFAKSMNLNFDFSKSMNLNLVFSNSTFAKSMNLNFDFSKSMNLNLNLVFSKSMNLNLNLKIKNKMNGSNQCRR